MGIQVRMSYYVALEEFILTKQAEGLSHATITWYRYSTLRFTKFLGQDLPLDDALDRSREYVVELRATKLSSSSVAGYVRALLVFMNWSYGQGYLTKDPSKILKRVRERQRVPDPLTDLEIKLLMNNLPNPKTFIGCRNRVALMLMLDSGLRVGELSGIRVKDVHMNDREIRVLGKGDKERVIPLGDTTLAELRRYVTWRTSAKAAANEDHLLLTITRTATTRNTYTQFIKRFGDEIGLPRLHPHLLRHTAAMTMLKNGADAFSVQAILGHSTPAMTNRYVHATKTQLGKRHREWSPIDKFLSDQRKKR